MIPDAYIETVFRLWEESGEECVRPIAGNCMSPVIREGDLLTIRFGSQDIRFGDIIVYSVTNRLLVHRVLRRIPRDDEDAFHVMSHAGPRIMHRVSRVQILGKVTIVSGSNGRLSLQSPYWRTVNCLFAARSYIQGKCEEKVGWFWNGIGLVLRFKAKIFPGPGSLRPYLWKVVCHIPQISSPDVINREKKTGEGKGGV
jgi:hypothetical protein